MCDGLRLLCMTKLTLQGCWEGLLFGSGPVENITQALYDEPQMFGYKRLR